MAFLLIPVILLAVVWLSYICRRLSELNENVNTAMNQIGLQLSSRFRALEALLELARTHGLSAQLVLLPPSINALSTPAQVLEQEQHLAQAMSYITIAAENHPSLKADPAYQRCMEAANCYSRMVYTSSLIYNDSVTRLNCALEQKRLGLLAGLLGIAPAGIPAVCTGCTGGLSCPALAAFSAGTRIKLLHHKSPAPRSA